MKKIFISDIKMLHDFIDLYGNKRISFIADYLDEKAGFKTKSIKTRIDINRMGTWFYVEEYKKKNEN